MIFNPVAREDGGVTLKRITLWAVLLRALKNATSSRKGDWGHAIRVMLVLAGIGYGGFGLYHGTPDRKDFKSAYPAYGQLETASGMLVEERTRRTSYFLLEETDKPAAPVIRDHRLITDKPVIPIVSDYTLYTPLRDQGWKETSGSFSYIPHFVSVKYFRLPSHWAWIAELEYEGKTLINYEQRKKDFALRKQDQVKRDRRAAIVVLLAALAFTWIVFEAYVQLKRKNQNGNK
jgi:hypothetical protein